MPMMTHQWTLAALLAGAAVLLPGAGPLADEPSPPIELDDSISAVTVYSDQAAVTRSATVRLPAGRSQVAFDPLPAGARPATVQVVAEGGDILAVEVLPPWPAAPGAGWTAELAEQRRLYLELADLQPRYDALRSEATLLTSLRRQPQRKEGELGAVLLATTRDEPVGRWQAQRLAILAAEAEQLRVAARSLRGELDVLERGLAPAQIDQRIRVVATLSLRRAATVKLQATTRVAGPRWAPDYDLHLDPEQGRGRVGVNALVSQATGEDWRGVPLRLSTAIPGAAATLPKLTAWYLQEQAPPEPEPSYEEVSDYKEAAPRREKSKKSAAASRPSRRSSAPEPMAPAESAVYDYDGDSAGLSVEMSGSVRRDGGGGSGAYAQSPVSVPSATRHQAPVGDLVTQLLGPPPTGAPVLSPPSIAVPAATGPSVDWSRFHPARQAGGFDYAMTSAGPVNIPSDGVARRIPLLSLELPARFEHRVPSAVQEAGYLYALLEQNGQTPLLAGEARVFQSGDLLGNSTLPMSARGATFEMPLGKDEQLRVERKVDEVADRSGPIAGGESVSRTVTLKLRNLRPDAVHAVVTDRIPVTWQDGMKVEMVEEPSPAAKVDAAGLIVWRVDLAPGADATLTFSYLIRHPRNTALREQ